MASHPSKLDRLIIQIDGIHIEEDLTLSAAVGINRGGEKHNPRCNRAGDRERRRGGGALGQPGRALRSARARQTKQEINSTLEQHAKAA